MKILIKNFFIILLQSEEDCDKINTYRTRNALATVSYTHLDVYKRQVQTPTGGSSGEYCTMGETLMQQRRVSEEVFRYVDVYKRQDNIREIIDEVSYSPAEGKYKVYIIDEVHMLCLLYTSGTDMTFGFQSAVDIATDAIDCIHTTAASHGLSLIHISQGTYQGISAKIYRHDR